MSDQDVVHGSLSEALVAAQAEMPAVDRDGTNPHFGSSFVSLSNLVAKTRPVLNRHGIAVTQFPSIDANDKPTLVTLLLHGPSGERLEYPAPLLLPKADPQGQGSAITYMRRYAWSSALGIVDQEDDDGNGARQATAADPLGQPADDALLAQATSALRYLTDEHFGAVGPVLDGTFGGKIRVAAALTIVNLAKALRDARGDVASPTPPAVS